MVLSFILVFIVLASTTLIRASPLPLSNKTILAGRQGLTSVIYSCTIPNTAALTFDDGPYIWLYDVVNQLNAAGARGTFFFNGNNFACIYNADSMDRVRYAYNNGHMIASHTWSHANLATLSFDQIHDQMFRVEQAFQRIVGVTPAFMRPPYGAFNDLVRSVAAARGQSLVLWDFDSGDSRGFTPDQSNAAYDGLVGRHPSTVLALNHEIHDGTVHQVLPHALSVLKGAGYHLVTLAECLGTGAYKNVEAPQSGSFSC